MIDTVLFCFAGALDKGTVILDYRGFSVYYDILNLQRPV